MVLWIATRPTGFLGVSLNGLVLIMRLSPTIITQNIRHSFVLWEYYR